MRHLQDRVIYYSKKYKLSHIGSCITALPIILEMYEKKKPKEKVVISCGHAHLSHLIVQEYFGLSSVDKYIQHDIHCNFEAGCDVATGSLGMGASVALGLSLATPEKKVWLLTSDGEMEEGVIWETLKIKADLKVDNLIWYVNANGYSAMKEINTDVLERRVHAFCPDVKVVRTNFEGYDFLKGISAHYKILP